MGNEPEATRPARRYIRIPGPFDAYSVGPPRRRVLVYDLNLGGGLVSFLDEQPSDPLLVLELTLPYEGRLVLHAEPVSRQEFGIGVRFVDVDDDTLGRLARSVDALIQGKDSLRATLH